MKTLIALALAITTLGATTNANAQGQYANVNGIRMYYEIHGSGRPLVLIHGGGSTIHTNFGVVMPMFARGHRVIAVELQAHGHTSDRGVPSSFQQDADDVAELLKQLNIASADVFGFSNGGQTAMELAMRHPDRVRKLVLASTFTKKSGVPAAFWGMMNGAKFSDMPQVYKDEFRRINRDPAALMTMFTRDSHRMETFTGWSDDAIRSITAPSLVVAGDRDVLTPEHAVEMSHLLPHARLVILPSAHGTYLGEIATAVPGSKLPALFVDVVNEFLAAP
ncbi:MAG: alpha/beta hydrolase [Gemmatimonadaceae bacterium]